MSIILGRYYILCPVCFYRGAPQCQDPEGPVLISFYLSASLTWGDCLLIWPFHTGWLRGTRLIILGRMPSKRYDIQQQEMDNVSKILCRLAWMKWNSPTRIGWCVQDGNFNELCGVTKNFELTIQNTLHIYFPQKTIKYTPQNMHIVLLLGNSCVYPIFFRVASLAIGK